MKKYENFEKFKSYLKSTKWRVFFPYRESNCLIMSIGQSKQLGSLKCAFFRHFHFSKTNVNLYQKHCCFGGPIIVHDQWDELNCLNSEETYIFRQNVFSDRHIWGLHCCMSLVSLSGWLAGWLCVWLLTMHRYWIGMPANAMIKQSSVNIIMIGEN